VSTISATAHKLDVIIWNLVVNGIPYHNPTKYLFHVQKENLECEKNPKTNQ
jgi:hypothetical protein